MYDYLDWYEHHTDTQHEALDVEALLSDMDALMRLFVFAFIYSVDEWNAIPY